ncbi:MAG: cofC [Solirubrobacterales bacterium]|nr:cofC [Solirubrobacterales bacterium]
MRTAAILPVKRFSMAKQRLGASVAEPLRLQLARAMVADVLAALAETESNEITIVVTREEAVAEMAATQGAVVVDDIADAGQSAAAELGVQRALAEGIERILCVPGDCPALDPAELEDLLEPRAGGADRGRPEPEVVIVPDRHGTGTNGLLLSPPDAISPSFGPGSFERHRALALAAGLPCRVERPPSLLLDIDTGADLAALRERLTADQPGHRRTRASRTRAVLGRADGMSPLPLTTPA